MSGITLQPLEAGASAEQRLEQLAHVDARVVEACQSLRLRVPEALRRPEIGVVLGSGLGGFTTRLAGSVKIPHAEVPHLRSPGVPGHAGNLVFGTLGDVRVACLSGRVHLYEGHDVSDVVFGCRLLAGLGCRTVLVTNAAGGIQSGLTPGMAMLIVDHLNLTGRTPLAGAPSPFVDMTHAYDLAVAEAARDAAKGAGVALAEGVYAGVLGPSYETPAEIRMLRVLGADAVGMSTVVEVIALRHLGVSVGAVSCITNLAAGLSGAALDHDEVQKTARLGAEAFEALLQGWVIRCGQMKDGG